MVYALGNSVPQPVRHNLNFMNRPIGLRGVSQIRACYHCIEEKLNALHIV